MSELASETLSVSGASSGCFAGRERERIPTSWKQVNPGNDPQKYTASKRRSLLDWVSNYKVKSALTILLLVDICYSAPGVLHQQYCQFSRVSWYYRSSLYQEFRGTSYVSRGGHSHMHHSHGCVRGQDLDCSIFHILTSASNS